MHRYLTRRILYAFITFLGITVCTFVLVHVVPGDPISFYIGKIGLGRYSPAALDAIRHEFHLDRPMAVQYAYWLRGVVTLDFGRSLIDHRLVTERILEKLPHTFLLNLIAFVIAALIGIPIGLAGGKNAGRRFDRASSLVFFLLYSLPAFWVGLMLMQWLSVRHDILPLMGMHSDGFDEMSGGERLLDLARHLVLPVATLTYTQIAVFARFSRSALAEVIRQDFITTARAKGAGEGAVLWRHAFRNALLPLITLLGLTIPSLISASVIVEGIFQWDGIGRLYLDSILARDYPTIMGLTVATAVVTLLASLLADVLYSFADPRIRLGDAE